MLDLTITNDGTLITITGLTTADGSAWASVDAGNGEAITAVTISVWKGCTNCSNCADEDYLATYTITLLTTNDAWVTNNSGQLVLNSTTYLQTTGTAYAALSDDVYHVDIVTTVVDADTVSVDQTYHICTYVDNDLKCRIIKSILANNENDDLVNIHNALTNASECGNCCKVCELHGYLTDVLDNLDNCSTC